MRVGGSGFGSWMNDYETCGIDRRPRHGEIHRGANSQGTVSAGG